MGHIAACGVAVVDSWYVGEWEECQCAGFVVRPVVCYVQDQLDGLYRVASPTVCPAPRPPNLRPCTPAVNLVCRFHWSAGPWSEVPLCRAALSPATASSTSRRTPIRTDMN